MSDQEILHKAVSKAEDNNYKFPRENCMFYPLINSDFEYPYFYYTEEWTGTWSLHINEIIFDHGFAKAFWGTHTNDAGWTKESNYTKLERIEEWQYHLQQMVLEEEPLKYLERFL